MSVARKKCYFCKLGEKDVSNEIICRKYLIIRLYDYGDLMLQAVSPVEPADR